MTSSFSQSVCICGKCGGAVPYTQCSNPRKSSRKHRPLPFGVTKKPIFFRCNDTTTWNCPGSLILRAIYAGVKLDRRHVLAILWKCGHDLKYVPEYQDDREAVDLAVGRHGRALQYASQRLRRNRETVSIAVSQDVFALKYVAPELLHDREVMLDLIRRNGAAISWVERDLVDEEMLLASVTSEQPFAAALRHVKESIRENRDLAIEIMKLLPLAFKHMSRAFRGDEEIAFYAIMHHGELLRLASPELQQNEEFVKFAARMDRGALKYTTPELREKIQELLDSGKLLPFVRPVPM